MCWGDTKVDSVDPLVRLTSGEAERAIRIAPLSVCRIGRDVASDVVLSSAGASRTHAMIRCDLSGVCYLSDAGSRNGTQLNGKPVSAPVPLSNGDTISIGGDTLTFEQAAAPAPFIEAEPAPATQIMLSTSFVTALVTDIRGYTQLTHEIGEGPISVLLSDYFDAVGKLLHQRGCWYQKYIGDAVFALWVHDQPQVDRRTLATVIDAILAMQELVAPLQNRFGLAQPVRFGVGINSGLASMGNLGSAGAADFTAVGDTINKAFRLEGATRNAPFDIVIGHSSLDLVFPAIVPPRQARPMALPLKGFDAPEPAYGLHFADLPALAGVLIGSGPDAQWPPQGAVA